jgi:4-amino-4-deoxy-L-arabinose transferase-like glycosyltransferase
VLVGVVVIGALYALHYADRGWVPHDEGALSHSAERVLAGELPHRDFDEIYTGGLTYMDAAAFAIFGRNLLTLRYVLLFFFTLWIPAVYYIARKFAAPLTAGAVVLAAVVWSVPNYFAGIPSWYNLFFATFGVVALFRYLDTRSRWWIFAAGLVGGLSFLIKLSGLYYVIGAGLFLVFHEHFTSQETEQEPRRLSGYSALIAVALIGLLVFWIVPVFEEPGLPEFTHFALPGLVLVAFLWRWEMWHGAGSGRRRLSTLADLIGPFAVGVLLPILAFLVPYAVTGSLDDFVRGVFILPARRLEFARMPPPPLIGSALAAPIPIALLGSAFARRRPHIVEAAVVLLGMGAVLILAPDRATVYRFVWLSIVLLVPISVVIGTVVLSRGREEIAKLRQQQIALLLFVVALHSLIQFPFSAPIYFVYVAPLGLLAVLGLVTLRERVSHFAPAAVLGFYIAFGVLWVNTGYIWHLGGDYQPDIQTERLELERGGIRVSRDKKVEYERLVGVLRQYSTSDFIFATPDAPEVYFLSGYGNPTRTLFDFFNESEGRSQAVMDALDSHHVNLVVLNRAPHFSGPVPPELLRSLRREFPQALEIGRFVVLKRR